MFIKYKEIKSNKNLISKTIFDPLELLQCFNNTITCSRYILVNKTKRVSRFFLGDHIKPQPFSNAYFWLG